ncbi:uncharacterized protein M421DRAFT_421122 [Didymella exigua CBS 183.55]|uniref:Uncharacterized protein n=1 Tax=Didymella exigua CBS 183.55 TaxID=1150837 RepID=A0A6A5RKZ0_9PLEO|nr:uncharacterized protein M421DRAFT_421122 [Didymella exigua CBS 183.55]KAF1927920.1 hypothetical protein M421DRAFT_421122 [Didymella exigua CBS 183.55]
MTRTSPHNFVDGQGHDLVWDACADCSGTHRGGEVFHARLANRIGLVDGLFLDAV